MNLRLFPLRKKRPALPPPAPEPAAGLTFIFAHLPKCGGKTFNSLLERNFPSAYYREESLYSIYPYTARDVDFILRYRQTLRALSSHRLTLDLPWTTAPRPLRALVFLRDPIERALSTYFFIRAHAHLEAGATHQTLDEFLRQNPPLYTNFQAQFLSWGRLTVPQIAELARLGWAHLFPLERFDDALLALARAYPAHFRDLPYQRLNHAPRTAELSLPARATLKAANTLDYQLLALAHQHLDTLLAKHYPDPAQLDHDRATLRQRCAAFVQI